MNMNRSRATVVLTSLALLLGACSGEGAPEVDAVASSPTAQATEEVASPSPETRPEPEETATAEPSPEPCPEGQQRVVPGGDCFEPTPPPSPSPEPEPEPEPAQTQTSEPEPGPCDRDSRTFTVVATNFQFDPGSLGEVCVGDTIVMQNEEGSHTLKESEGSTRETSSTSSGESASLTVEDTGSYDFFCGFHPQQMRTSVDVAG